jgi:rRNA processing protein Gar1
MGEVLNTPKNGTTIISDNNQSAIAYSHNAVVTEKTKHIGMKWHFLKEHVEHGTIR